MKSMKLFAWLLFVLAVPAVSQVAVVVNKSVDAGSVTAIQIASMYALDVRSWPGGEKIVVFDSKNDDAKKTFYAAIGRTEMEMKKQWMRMQLSGNGKAPESLGSDADVIAKVASTPGAIGYVQSASVSGNVKVVLEIK